MFTALQCAASSSSSPPDALLLVASPLSLLDQTAPATSLLLASAARAAPRLYNKAAAPDQKQQQQPCRWLQAPVRGGEGEDKRRRGVQRVGEVKVLRVACHALHVLPPPALDHQQVAAHAAHAAQHSSAQHTSDIAARLLDHLLFVCVCVCVCVFDYSPCLQEVGLFLLASPSCREVCPLSLHSLGRWRVCSVQCVAALSFSNIFMAR